MTPATAALFDALGDPTRRAIVSRIARGPVSVSALATPLGISLTAVGQHLRLLEKAGLVLSEKQGRTRSCALRPEGLRAVEQWAQACRKEWEARLDRLGDLLDALPDA
ncbi:ArsR/SmtB family transcription factor [Sphingobium nicotianae]|uniref:ArsR family transcriptional regulator n=1 Tax=Sphingobium nicotianae TaxID=2782607 RepID=A0A9X1AJR5_9SPHN|nr:metalloregulator ArsR/SmtB family transcription factor [Sphingobium nicotianae]MBT2185468.1 ArsR family transcriptional regulator [Sphingobium nicotianae]